MYLLYSLALSLLFIALLPYFAYQAIRHGKYLGSFKERMGWPPDSVRAGDRPVVWVHAVSVGEFNAARPLIERLKREFPERRIVVSTTTVTGQRLARAAASGSFDGVFFFPFDWAFAVRRALDHVKPAAVVILETELWPNFLRECRRRQVAAMIVNGRISPRSFSRYLKARRFIAGVMADASLLVMQTEQDAKRALALGARLDSVRVCGNLKYELSDPNPAASNSVEELDRRLSLSSPSGVIVAGSTAPGEEAILLDALREVRRHKALEGCRLVIAPRHPERFNEVAGLIARSGFRFVRRSEAASDDGGRAAEVILLDSVGELAAVYKFAAVVFVGGSLVPRGGHNIIEPALYAKPIIVGPHTENFRQVVADFASAGAVIQLDGAQAGRPDLLAREVVRLLSDADYSKAMGERAQNILLNSRGAIDCTMAAIRMALSDHHAND
jgi:3-deoxy-D-manno-octulosonic-acid transferase